MFYDSFYFVPYIKSYGEIAFVGQETQILMKF
jgi:hypothetical protein